MKYILNVVILAMGIAFFMGLGASYANTSCNLEILHSNTVTFGVRDLVFSKSDDLSWLGKKRITDDQFDWLFGSIQKDYLTVKKKLNTLSSVYDDTHMSVIDGNTYTVASAMPNDGLQATWHINKKDSVNNWTTLDSFQFPIPAQATSGFGSGITRIVSDHSNNLYIAGCITFVEGEFKTSCLVRKSEDAGITWKTIYNFPTNIFSKVVSLQISSTNQIYLIGQRDRQTQTEKDVAIVKVSRDLGNTWADFADFEAQQRRIRVQDGAIDSQDTLIVLDTGHKRHNGADVCYNETRVKSLRESDIKGWSTYVSYFPPGSCGGDGNAQVKALPKGGFVIHANNGSMLPPGVENGQLSDGTKLEIFRDGNFQRIEVSAKLGYDVYPVSLAVSETGDIAYSVAKFSGFKEPVIEIKKARCSYSK